MDPLTLALGIGAAAAGLSTGLGLQRRLRRAEANAARLRRELERQQHAANHDSLTGLANRRGFYRLGHQLIAHPTHPAIACVVVDLNAFKQINDTFGHAAGDEVLIVMARRLARFAEGGTRGNLVARLGGDEFVGLFRHPAAGWAELYPAAADLADALARPVPTAGRELRVTASVGAAVVNPQIGLPLALTRADSAMYRAKATGTRVACYQPGLDDEPGWPGSPTLVHAPVLHLAAPATTPPPSASPTPAAAARSRGT